jgi:hypothetical protein
MYWCIVLLAKALLDATTDFVADIFVVDKCIDLQDDTLAQGVNQALDDSASLCASSAFFLGGSINHA